MKVEQKNLSINVDNNASVIARIKDFISSLPIEDRQSLSLNESSYWMDKCEEPTVEKQILKD